MIEHREVWDSVREFERVLIDGVPWAVLHITTDSGIHKAIRLPVDLAKAMTSAMDAELNPPPTPWKGPTQR